MYVINRARITRFDASTGHRPAIRNCVLVANIGAVGADNRAEFVVDHFYNFDAISVKKIVQVLDPGYRFQ